jgi:hypothetical protein
MLFIHSRGLGPLPRFRTEDRVQLVGDIARFYACIVGVVTAGGSYPASVLNQYTVRLADGIEGVFFDFQLETPPLVTARLLFDNLVERKKTGVRDLGPGRNIRFVGAGIDINLRMTGSGKRTVVGEITSGSTAIRKAIVTLLVENQSIQTTATNDMSQFTLRDVSPGGIGIEVCLPGRRILASVTV